MDRGPLKSESQSQFEFSDEMKRELATRDTRHAMKMDDFKSYTTEYERRVCGVRLVPCR